MDETGGLTAPLLSVREVAEQLGVPRSTVYGLVDAGVLPHTRVANAIRVHPNHVAGFAARIWRKRP